jgi:RNA polymerase sigma factor (sigma-70 family)
VNSQVKITEWDNDVQLLERLASHNPGALEALYKEFFPIARKIVIKNNGQEADAEDIFQEAIIILLEKSRSGSFHLECRLKTYLYSVCRHLWLKRLNGQSGQLPLSEVLEDTVPVNAEVEEYEKKDQEYAMMHEALTQLGEPCKTLIENYYLHKKSMLEIAAEFGYTNADNAKNQKYKCLMRLKKIFFAQYKQL